MTVHLPSDVADSVADLALHYDIVNTDVRGANGFTFFARNAVTHQQVVIKYYSSEEGRLHDEPRLLASVQSPNVLRILDARVVSDDWAYFITPHCTGGDLDDVMAHSQSARKAVDLVLHVCSGVSAIHQAGLVHRDLKPANIVMEAGVPQIADFGSVRALCPGIDAVAASRHSILYRPPECFDGGLFSRAGDIYQIGLIAYQLMGGSLPYDGEAYLNREDCKAYANIHDEVDRSIFVDSVVERRIKAGTLIRLDSLPPWFRHSALPMLRRMTAVKPNVRPGSTADIVAELLRLRARVPDWQLDGSTARLESKGRTIELRVRDDGRYEAFTMGRGGARRVAGTSPGTLAELVRVVSS